ncbi:MAG: tRNA epoxyqueuosine(34) reductase QueG [Vampirovibrionales bacterium]
MSILIQQRQQQIRTLATELGFCEVGFLPPLVLQEESQRLQQWLTEGKHADMTWMQTHAHFRTQPSQLIEDCQGVVVLLMNYAPPPEVEPKLKIARYAWGKDYHKVIRKKLQQLLAKLQQSDPTLQGRGFTDSAPILEKALPVRAGLGWQGKNSLLLTKKHGSYVFIAELLLNQPVVEAPSHDSPVPWQLDDTNHCGRCQRCITACPTDALVAPTVMDANQCIAFWTIESSSPTIPEPIAEKQAGWVFGCDVCQEVCPWNERFAHPHTEPEFQPRPWLMNLTAEQLLTMDEATFDTTFTNTPLRRTGLKRLQRNVRNAIK